ncbi:MAG: type II secretion system GspH family protein [Candidatus Omnitrophica bacterium]|nr:type II secretion system GspH family protein [Candidatus Omnitrophota bacterium]
MRKARQIRNKCGFTLVEVIVSLALLVITSAGALYAIHMANILSIEAKEMTIAMNDARSVLEQVKITGLSSLPNNTTVNASTLWANLATFISNNLASEQVQITGGSGASLRQITVTVSWIGPRNRAKSVQFTTLKSLFNG